MNLDKALTGNIPAWSDAELDAAWLLLGRVRLAIRRKYDMTPALGRMLMRGKVPQDPINSQWRRLCDEVRPYLLRSAAVVNVMMDRQMDAARGRSQKRSPQFARLQTPLRN